MKMENVYEDNHHAKGSCTKTAEFLGLGITWLFIYRHGFTGDQRFIAGRNATYDSGIHRNLFTWTDLENKTIRREN